MQFSIFSLPITRFHSRISYAYLKFTFFLEIYFLTAWDYIERWLNRWAIPHLPKVSTLNRSNLFFLVFTLTISAIDWGFIQFAKDSLNIHPSNIWIWHNLLTLITIPQHVTISHQSLPIILLDKVALAKAWMILWKENFKKLHTWMVLSWSRSQEFYQFWSKFVSWFISSLKSLQFVIRFDFSCYVWQTFF